MGLVPLPTQSIDLWPQVMETLCRIYPTTGSLNWMKRSMSLIRLGKIFSALMMLACVQGPLRPKNQSALSVQISSTSPNGTLIIPSTQLLMLDRQIRDCRLPLMSISVSTQFLIMAVEILRSLLLTNPTRLEISYSQTISTFFPRLVV